MIEIIQMTSSHVAAVAQLELVCFQDPWSEKSISAELVNPLSLWLVAVEDTQVLGYVGSQTVLGESDMMNLAVDPRHRRRGIGGKLVESLVESLRLQGSSCLTLEVRSSNDAAKSLYQSLGFVQIGRRPNYYRNPKEDALILRKEWQL